MTLHRRRFLLGLGGVTVALPFLPSIHSPPIARAGGERAGFAVFMRAGNGVQQAWSDEPESFWPRATGAITTAMLRDANGDRATSELAPFADRLNLLRGVRRPFGTPACGHSESIVQCLTGAQSTGGSANDPLALGMSADWRIVEQLDPAGREPLCFMAGPDSAYIAEALSWRRPRERTPAERSPWSAYMRMMGLSSAPPEIQVRIAMRRESVNDLIRDQMSELLGRPELGSRDRARLRQHFEAIRDLELSMACELAPDRVAALMALDNPRANDVRVEAVQRFADVIAFAFSCGLTHAATLQVGEGNDQTQYEIGGSRLPRFHWISHRIYSDGADGEPIPNAVELHHQVDRLHLSMYRYLLERLDAYPSAYGGTMLDESVAVWMNDLGNGPPHGGDNVPWLLAGSGGGRMRTGQFQDLGGATINRVLNTILTGVGCTKPDGSAIDDFGDAGLTGGTISSLLV